MTEETLFELALNIPAADRPALLDRECAEDPTLRARVEALLAAHERLEDGPGRDPGPPMPAQAGDATAPPSSSESPDPRPAEGVGSLLAGKYKLVEEIGEGGMGAVFLAQQTAPVKRTVAVKVIKAGMDSRAVLARFDAERQAIALMDHPNIARVLDAGATDSGRPFFVMELVKGTPITTFCDERRLTPQQRLELFVPVCQAIQHAHQKGVIHRDIKPSNVLVALYDDHPVPKVIDFGVAKATGPQLTEQTLMTGFGAVVGTPEYMSPEQAALNNLDIDTRSDVYALGVLLYELLTGSTPVDRRSLGRAAVLEVLRIVREVEPPRPSTRLSTTEALASIAASRNTEPARLAGLLRGELDWIAMKALEKDRARRYETANALARDVQRYLADEVVEARPPSAGYRMRKFVRRHKGRVVAASLVLLALVAGIIGTTWGYVRAERARAAEERLAEGERLARLDAQEQKRQAEAANARAQKRLEQIEKGNEVLTGIFSDLNIRMVREQGKPLERVLADRLVQAAGQLEGESIGDPLAVATLQLRLGQSLVSLGFAPQAIPVLEKARKTRNDRLGPDHLDTMHAMVALADACQSDGRRDRALALFEEAWRLAKARFGPDHPDTLVFMNALALSGYWTARQFDRALPLWEEGRRLSGARLGADHPQTLLFMTNLAWGYREIGQLDRAVTLYEELVPLMKAKLGTDNLNTLTAMANLADCYQAAGRPDRAVPLFEEAFRLQKAAFGPDHSFTLGTMNRLGGSYVVAGQPGRAVPILEEAWRLTKARLGLDHPQTLSTMRGLAWCYQAAGTPDRALPLYEESLRLTKAKLGPDHPDTLIATSRLATSYRAAGQRERALALLEESFRLTKAKLGLNHADTLNEMAQLASLYAELGRSAEAAAMAGDAMAVGRKVLPKDDPKLAAMLAPVGLTLLKSGAFADAEPVIRDCLAIRDKAEPDAWTTSNTRSMLGGALLGQKKYTEAEPLLREGYAGMKARAKAIPPAASPRLIEALDRLIELYSATNKPDEVREWRAERARYDKDAGSKTVEKK